jgi:AhpD family alkylhydroperoxidase
MPQTTTQTNVATDPKVAELIALAAAVGSNCEACFRTHYDSARAAGLSTDEIVRALELAEAVKATPARRMRELAARKLDVPVTAFGGGEGAQAVSEGEPAGRSEAEADCGCGAAAPVAPAAPTAAATECC